MNRMFYNCYSITILHLDSFNTLKVLNMDEMFFGCSSLFHLYLINFEANSLLSHKNMFNKTNSHLVIYTNDEFDQILNS